MHHFRALILLPFLLVASPTVAATPEEIDRLYNALGTPELVQIMHDEGLAQAVEMEDSMFDGQGGDAWRRIATGIYDPAVMEATFRETFDTVLADVDIAPLLEFYDSDLGAQIVELELSARRALTDEDVEAAAEEAYARMAAEDDPRLVPLEAFVVANDLIELNVEGGLNASLAFYEGLADGGFPMTQEDIATEVWSQEPEIRADTEVWLYSYLAMAYEPLSEEGLFAYTEMTLSESGRALNRALFDGFDKVFEDISYALGRAAAKFDQGEEL